MIVVSRVYALHQQYKQQSARYHYSRLQRPHHLLDASAAREQQLCMFSRAAVAICRSELQFRYEEHHQLL